MKCEFYIIGKIALQYGDFGIRDGNEHCDTLHIGTGRDSKKLLKCFFLFYNNMIILFLFVMKLILLTWKGITILPQAIWISLDLLGFFGFFSYIICSFYSVNFPPCQGKKFCVHPQVSRGRIPGCSLKPWSWHEKKKKSFWSVFILTGYWRIPWIVYFCAELGF